MATLTASGLLPVRRTLGDFRRHFYRMGGLVERQTDPGMSYRRDAVSSSPAKIRRLWHARAEMDLAEPTGGPRALEIYPWRENSRPKIRKLSAGAPSFSLLAYFRTSGHCSPRESWCTSIDKIILKVTESDAE